MMLIEQLRRAAKSGRVVCLFPSARRGFKAW